MLKRKAYIVPSGSAPSFARAVTAVSWILLIAGCGAPAEDDVIEAETSAILNYPGSNAAETTVTTALTQSFGMSWNWEDDTAHETFDNNSRQIRPGTSLMGYTKVSPNSDGGSQTAPARVRPPSGWSVLWGDPAITRNRGSSSRFYLSNLAIPTSKFPGSGIIDGPVNPAGLPANFCNAYIGGACIARSSDGGFTYTLAAGDCVQRITTACPMGTFYDGSDLETATGTSGRVYAAFTDITRSATDVYLATSSTGSFQRVTDPPGVGSTFLHPRLRFGPNGLYLIQYTGGASLTITRYPAGSSRTAAWSTPVTVANSIASTDVVLSDRTIRLGPQYDLAIGTNENGAQEVRIIFATITGGNHHIHVAKCTTGTPITCSQPAIWNTDTIGGKQWGPAITAGTRANGTPFWSISFYNTSRFPGGNQLDLWTGSLPNSSSFSVVFQDGPQVPCPDLRGYWGDYDRMSTGTDISGVQGFTYRGLTASNLAACTRFNYHTTAMSAGVSFWSL